MLIWPLPSALVSFGTKSTTTPALRRASPMEASAPTFHSRPIWSATSAASRPPRSGSVTIAISPPLRSRTARAMASIVATTDGCRTPAKSFTNPRGGGIVRPPCARAPVATSSGSVANPNARKRSTTKPTTPPAVPVLWRGRQQTIDFSDGPAATRDSHPYAGRVSLSVGGAREARVPRGSCHPRAGLGDRRVGAGPVRAARTRWHCQGSARRRGRGRDGRDPRRRHAHGRQGDVPPFHRRRGHADDRHPAPGVFPHRGADFRAGTPVGHARGRARAAGNQPAGRARRGRSGPPRRTPRILRTPRPPAAGVVHHAGGDRGARGVAAHRRAAGANGHP